MTEYFQKNLFKDISIDEYKSLLTCLNARTKQFKPGSTICDYDQGFHDIGIIGTGSASVVRYEFNGARTILEKLEPQDIFGHLLSYEGSEHAGISVISDSLCSIMFIQYATVGAPCHKACAHHHQLTQNLLDLISERALSLSRRVEVLSQRTIREKLICYFMQLASQAKSSTFQLSFTMVDLADYLSIDRSAMTRELKRMKEENLIQMDRKTVRLLL
ncbi:MAG: Crp/Fnr family transcriptional regulator [Clostridium sp.]|nr:Crp/Fnr family transcriptional regulator [Clostridium sp.]